MKLKKFHNVLVLIVPLLVSWLLRLWFATCRVAVHGAEHRKSVLPGRQPIIATFWHYSILYVFYHLRADSAAVLVSSSADGDYIARLAQYLHFTVIRGSKNQRGFRALKELMVHIVRGGNIGMVADGSQGPPQILQAGSILLASRTGAPILPMVWSASRSFVFRSWDRTAVPLPFSRIEFFYGNPFIVPSKIRSEEIETYRLKLENEMNVLYNKAWSVFDRDAH